MSAGAAYDMLATASMAARLIAAIYEDRESVVELAKHCGRVRFRYVEAGYVTAAVLCFDDHVHIAIGGTNDAYDWVQNVSAKINDADDIPMHAGFRQSAEWIYESLLRGGVMELLAGRRLILSGHSSGGAIAAAMASEVICPNFVASEVYTFGAPRVFSPTLAFRFVASPAKLYRIVLQGDPIPRLPLRQLSRLFGRAQYAHAGMEMLMQDDGSITVEKPSFTYSLWKAFTVMSAWSLFKLTPFRIVSVLRERHRIGRYLMALNEAMSRTI